MNENVLENALKKIMYNDTLEVFVFDVFEDKVLKYGVVDGAFTSTGEDTFTNYLEDVKTKVGAPFLSGFMNLVSIPKMKEALKDGNSKVEFKYQSLDSKWYKLSSTLINVSGKELIFSVKEELRQELNSTKESRDSRYEGLIGRLADSILKINNVFNLDSKSLSNVKAVEEYILSIFKNLYSTYPELKKSVNKTAANVSGRWEDAILIIDDDKIMRNMIKKVFKDDGYKLVELANGKEAIEYLEANESKGISEASDHVLGIFLDLTMPVLDGFAVLEYLSKKNYLNRLPVIIISGDYEKETKSRVYNYNIADMLEKPFDFEVVRHRISNFINLYKSSNSLNDLVSSQNNDLKALLNTFVDAYRYDYASNIDKISKYIKVLATQVMNDYPEYELTEEKINKMVDASMYYDIGFYSIPRSVLIKREKLTNDELELVRNYPLFGSKMIAYVLSLTSDELYKKYALNIAKYYHENYNGTGYPENLKGNAIPLEAQIAAICINYNNIKKKNGNATDFILNKSNTMFSPEIIESFKKVLEAFNVI